MSIRNGLLLTEGELNDLADHLAKVSDIAMALAIAATGHQSRKGGVEAHSAPTSRPPYNIGAQQQLDKLCNELGTTVRHICEHRCIEVPDSCGSILGQAQWLRRNVVAIAVMADAREIHASLCRTISESARAAGEMQREYRIDQHMVDEANRHDVDAGRVHKLAHKLGDQGKGLNRDRVDYLRRKGYLAGEWDEATGKWWYKLGDVLAAHKRAKESRKARA
ncbi:hypothetical protein SEA_BAXTERFOX_80 [Gordonia phage BaxterFox]|uniref:Helix-turn-helix DNA binding domain protein n=1 Tax=Gordonia phage BaxterFox TaxID=1821549 RepID=A0A142KCQ7_9CAUD|nr:hypothetical protein SEA_BAXTERFOX_80 [Gordonia phage BaxterFox]AMS03890.1 hypothetical protein SEA_BAXTERFOX_80 [Gordonia phage BaxterFox]